nr:hypothetical protein [Porphyromonas endodontalis]
MFVINIFERSSFGYVLSNEFVEQFNMGFVCGTIGFGKKDRNTERPLNGSKSHKFRSVIRRYRMQQVHPLEVSQTPINDPSQRLGILSIRQLFNDGIPRFSLGQSKDGFSLLSPDDKIYFEISKTLFTVDTGRSLVYTFTPSPFPFLGRS